MAPPIGTLRHRQIEVYNELIRGPAELSATLMIEIPESAQIRSELDRLVGIDEQVFLEVEDQHSQATFDAKQFEADRIAAVQYLRFPLGPELAARFADPGGTVALRGEHPAYRARAELEGNLRTRWLRICWRPSCQRAALGGSEC